jgi:hypothetical protein
MGQRFSVSWSNMSPRGMVKSRAIDRDAREVLSYLQVDGA